jgi:hypothetical protein
VFTSNGTFTVVLPPLLDNLPTVGNVQGTTAEAEGTITSTENENCDKRGFVWATTPQDNPGDTAPANTSYGDHTEETGDFTAGTFNLLVDGLNANTTYYLRAFAHNSGGYTYSKEIQFVSGQSTDAVELQANSVNNVNKATADVDTQINDVNGDNASERGFVYGDESVSLPGSVDPEVSGYDDVMRASGDFTAGAFTGSVSGLNPATEYFVRAWAKNDAGISYSNELSFRTLDNQTNTTQSTPLTNKDTKEVSLSNISV